MTQTFTCDAVAFDDVKRGDIVSLQHYPLKPFQVAWKNSRERRLGLECHTPVTGHKPFTAAEFDQEAYMRYPADYPRTLI